MWLHWEQMVNLKDKMQIWTLVVNESGREILTIEQSPYAEQKDNYKMRRRIKRMYEKYIAKVWFDNLRFF